MQRHAVRERNLPRVAVACFHAGAGGSAYSREWQETVKRISGNIPVVRSTRVSNGITIRDEAMDREGGTIWSGTLPPQKAKVLLTMALTRTKNREEIQRMFEEY